MDRYTLTNKHKAIVRLISWGASIQSIKVPNRDGKLADVVLGFDDMDGEFVEQRVVFQEQINRAHVCTRFLLFDVITLDIM